MSSLFHHFFLIFRFFLHPPRSSPGPPPTVSTTFRQSTREKFFKLTFFIFHFLHFLQSSIFSFFHFATVFNFSFTLRLFLFGNTNKQEKGKQQHHPTEGETATHSPGCGLYAFQVSLFRSSNSLCLGSAVNCQHFAIRVLARLISVVTVDVFTPSVAKTLLRLETFLLCSYHVFPHCFHETRCLIFLFFPFKKNFQLFTKLVLVPFFSLFISSCLFKHITQVSFSFWAFFATLCPRDFLLFHQCVKHFVVRRDLCPLSFRFRVLPGVYGALSAAASHGLLPTGFRWAVTLPTLPPFIFSVMAFFRTAVVFLTLDLFLLLSGGHEDDRNTLCMFLGQKGPRLPMSQIIHYCSVINHHLHQKKKV